MDDLDLSATIRGMSAGQRVVNRYVLDRMLGRGGMGVVWLAKDEELGRETALKFLPDALTLDRGAISDLKREVRRAIDLAHPHIVKIHDFITDSRVSAVSMEYITGDTLSSRRVDQPGQVFTPADLGVWVAQLCSALDYAHTDAEVVHRDLKPSNLMIDKRGRLKVLDFGIAASISDSVSRVSNKAGSSGTPIYMSPQQMMGEEPAVTDDIYALGATLFELLAGKPPFHAGNIVVQVQNKVAPLLNDRRRAAGLEPVPVEWEQTIAACLAKEPAARPQSAGEVAERLGLQAAGSTPRIAPRPAAPVAVAPAPAAPPLVVPAPVAARPPQISTEQLAKKAFRFLALCALGVNLFALLFMWVSDELKADNIWGLLGVTLFTFAVSWPSLFVGMVLWRALFGIKAPPVVPAKPPGLPWMRAAVAGALIPCAMLSAWPIYHGFGVNGDTTEMGNVLVRAAGAWPAYALLFALLQLFPLLRQARRLRDYVIYFAATGGVLSAAAYATGLILPGDLELGGATLVLSGLAAAVAWGLGGAAAHYLLFKERPSFGARRPLVLGALAAAVALAGYQLFVALPEEVQLNEYRADQEKKRIEAEAKVAEDARLATEATRVKREAEQKKKEAEKTVQAAYRMVFDQAPDQASLEAYTKTMLADPAYDATRLRHEMRASPQGKQGGRVLVPAEFKTIQDAIYEAIPGNVVLVAAGTYAESLYLDKAIELRGEGRDVVAVEVDSSKNALHVKGATGGTISGFTFRHTDTKDTERRASLIGFTGSSVRFIRNSVTAANGFGMYLQDGGNPVITENNIGGARWAGINVMKEVGGEISGNDIHDNEQEGLAIAEQTGRLLINRNTLHDNGSAGIQIWKGDGVTLTANELFRNGSKEANGGIGIFNEAGRPSLRGNVARDNKGSGIWWADNKNPPMIGPGNISDGKELPLIR